MSFDAFVTAAVIRYPFLWSRQAESGETEGRKSRPVAVGFRAQRVTGDVLWLFPITSQPPPEGRLVASIPATEKRRAGLDLDVPLWIILDELNEDVIGESVYLEPNAVMGRFSRAFFIPLMKRVFAVRERTRVVNRVP